MIPKIHEYIVTNSSKWPVQMGTVDNLRPMFRSNINYNFVENYPLITRIVFWFGKGEHYPVLISKIMDESISLDSIHSSIKFERTINNRIGSNLFPEIFDIAQIQGRNVIFQEAIKASTYDTELKRAILGPERSPRHLERVMERQFQEMGSLFNRLSRVYLSDETRVWGDWAHSMGKEFETRIGIRSNSWTERGWARMKKAVDSVSLPRTPVIADMACPNIFGGPKLIDNIIPDIDGLNNSLPGVINVFRFLVTYFYSPPVVNVYEDWLYALAVAITERGSKTKIGPLVRKILADAGVDLSRTEMVWAFFMAATLYELNDKLEFYKDSPTMLAAMKNRYYQWAKQMVRIQNSIRDGRTFDPKPVIMAHEYLRTQESMGVSLNPKQAILAFIPKSARPGILWLSRLADSNQYLSRMKENLIRRLYR